MQEQGGYRRDQLKNKLRDLTSKERARCTERIGIISSILRLVFFFISLFSFSNRKHKRHFFLCAAASAAATAADLVQ